LPRNGSDVYSLPATYPATTGELIEAQQHNDPLEDLEQDMNTARPIVAGGTGASSTVGGHDAFSTKGANIASAGTCDIGAASGMYVHITGTTTITAFGTKTAGVKRILVFDDILTLTHNATSLILPTGANITTAAGDVAHMVSEGSGNWKCVAFIRANGTALALPTSPTLVTPNITGSIAQTETNDTASGISNTTLHNSASPAASDIIWQQYHQGKDSAGNTENYALTRTGITDPTSTSEDGFWDIFTVIAGTLARRILVGAGFVVGSPTGGDPGAGKINATEVQENGVALGYKLTSGTAQVTTSGTAFDFTSIPSWVKRITVLFADVSLSGSDDILVQIGDSGGIETTGYASASSATDSGGQGTSDSTAGFIGHVGANGRVFSGTMRIETFSGNIWIASVSGGMQAAGIGVTGGGSKTLSGTLDRLRVTRNGTDTFDAGSVNILYE
jgi:hypothetical protein